MPRFCVIFRPNGLAMYSVRVRKHIMIAHSLPDPAFGLAQRLHGATYVVDAEFFSERLNAQNVVIDMGLALQLLEETLAPLDYRNLDELPEFEGQLTTTEFLAHYIHGQMSRRLQGRFEGRLRITLGESHIAWAAYEGDVA